MAFWTRSICLHRCGRSAKQSQAKQSFCRNTAPTHRATLNPKPYSLYNPSTSLGLRCVRFMLRCASMSHGSVGYSTCLLCRLTTTRIPLAYDKLCQSAPKSVRSVAKSLVFCVKHAHVGSAFRHKPTLCTINNCACTLSRCSGWLVKALYVIRCMLYVAWWGSLWMHTRCSCSRCRLARSSRSSARQRRTAVHRPRT